MTNMNTELYFDPVSQGVCQIRNCSNPAKYRATWSQGVVMRLVCPTHRSEIDGSKLMIFHAKDDPNVPYERTREFAELTGATLRSLKSGGPISTDYVSRKYWPQIKKFFDSKP